MPDFYALADLAATDWHVDPVSELGWIAWRRPTETQTVVLAADSLTELASRVRAEDAGRPLPRHRFNALR